MSDKPELTEVAHPGYPEAITAGCTCPVEVRSPLSPAAESEPVEPYEIIGTTRDGVEVIAPAVKSTRFSREEIKMAIKAAESEPVRAEGVVDALARYFYQHSPMFDYDNASIADAKTEAYRALNFIMNEHAALHDEPNGTVPTYEAQRVAESEPVATEGWVMVPDDLLSHIGDWRTAVTIARDATPASTDETDDRSYWQHQLQVLDRIAAMLAASPPPKAVTVTDEAPRKFSLGERVHKIKGASWHGRVVGFYSTSITPTGYAIESDREPGSVQIYPEAALSIQQGGSKE